MLNLHRQSYGIYLSHCGRVRIARRVVEGPEGGDRLAWLLHVDGTCLGDKRTKRDAVKAAEAEIRRREGL